ncbi:hypothetical protein CBS101457_000792 [Exobasidium rhododendri]|nr:hypothetical protein CBS101457_000792 [Exobasidium rhododendri]
MSFASSSHTSNEHDTHNADTTTEAMSINHMKDEEFEKKWTNKKYPWSFHVTSFSRILAHEYEGSGSKEDPYLIHWIHDDEENPTRKGEKEKWGLAVFVSFATLAVALASSAYTGATDSIAAEFGSSSTVITLGVSFFVLGFALGPLIWAPLSELYGRRNLYLISYSFLTLWNGVAAASPNMASLLVFRFLAGAFGSSPLTNAGGTIADVFAAKERGLAMAVFAAAPFMGPSLGPITGGFLGEKGGWKWVEGFLGIFSAVLLLLGFVMYSETYTPVLLRRRAKKLCEATGKHYISKLDEGKDVSVKNQFKIALSRPWLLLIYEPIVLLLSLYVAIVYAILYSFFSAFPIVFQEVRGWSPGIGGLAFLGILVGMLMGIFYVVIYVNPVYSKVVDKHGGVTAPPEARLPPSMVGAPLLVIGLAGFAATDAPSVFWFVPIMFGAPFGAGMVLIFLSIQNYLIDSYLLYAASVLAANSVVRSVFGAAFPLFTPYMYHPGGDGGNCPTESCGIHVGPAIAGALALLFLPFPFVFYRKGEAIRKKCKFSAEADKLLQTMLQGEDAEKGNEGKSSSPSEEVPKPARDEEEKPVTARQDTSTPSSG